MVKLQVGDRIDVRIKSSTIVSPYKEYDEIKTFEIVSTDNFGYYLFVPHYLCLNGTSIPDMSRCKKLGIEPRFYGEKIVYIMENMVSGISRQLDGMRCSTCHEFVEMATTNQLDGSFICWTCRNYPFYC